jgi:pimeloyl-ACP methyl ester carboxylesterase
LLAGGPGQPSTQLFNLGLYGRVWRLFFPGYTIVAFDPRGTGHSGLLSCPAFGANVPLTVKIVTACARQLGDRARFYSTQDNVDDVDAVRQALGLAKVSLWAVSYGTEVALGYAQAFPTHVQRLLLDSVSSPLSPNPFATEVLREIPSRLSAFCAEGACKGVTSDYSHDVVSLANALAAKPLAGRVLQEGGTHRTDHLTAPEFVQLVVQTDLDPGLAVELPAAVRAAIHGDAQPLLRLDELVNRGSENIDNTVSVATICDDGGFPWPPDTPISQRGALLKIAVARVPTSTLGGFGRWAVVLGNASVCLDWPPSAAQAAPTTTYPNVPVLAISGGFDMRTPRTEARAVLARFPQGHLLTVANAGHSALTANISLCLIEAVSGWVEGKPVAQSCRPPRLVAPVPAFSAPGTHTTTGATRPSDMLPLVVATLHDAEAVWLLLISQDGKPSRAAGLDSGHLTAKGVLLTLSRYSILPGVELSGTLQAQVALDTPLTFDGAVHLADTRTKASTFTVSQNAVTEASPNARPEAHSSSLPR